MPTNEEQAGFMIVAIDTNCILPGQVGGIENYTLGLIEALKLPGSPATQLVLLTRPENHEFFSRFADARTKTVLLPRGTPEKGSDLFSPSPHIRADKTGSGPIMSPQHWPDIKGSGPVLSVLSRPVTGPSAGRGDKMGSDPVLSPQRAVRSIDNWARLLEREPAVGMQALVEYQNRKANALREHRVDLLHCPGNTINPLGLDLPVVLNLHDLQHRHYPEYFTTRELENREKWWVRSAVRADALIAASNYVRDDLRQQLHICREKIFVTPDVFESAFFRMPDVAELGSLRDRLNLAGTFFLYPAAAWPHKNHERLIRAFLAADIPGAQLVLTGAGQESLAKWADHPKIRLLGRVETRDLVSLYHSATAMIFPSQHESWSIPIMEAMACGCPVACSNVTSLPEQIGDAGLLFEPNDESQMTNAMRRLAADSDLREILSDRGRGRVKRWGPALFLKNITAAYGFATGAFYARKAA